MGKPDQLGLSVAPSPSPVHFSSGILNFDQVQDFLDTLLRKNRDCRKHLREQADSLQFQDTAISMLLLKSDAAEYIIHLSDEWKYADDVKFTAIELYGKFLVKLLTKVYDAIYGKSKRSKIAAGEGSTQKNRLKTDTKQMHKQWQDTVQHIGKQIELRAVSCILIVSKLDVHCNCHITMGMAADYLNNRGLKYNTDALLKSEVRILQTLDYEFGSLPLVLPYIGIFVDYLFHVEPSFPAEKIYLLSIDLQNCFYPRSLRVFGQFCKVIRRETYKTPKTTRNLAELSHDMVLLGCGIVAAASYVWSNKLSDRTIKILSGITGISEEILVKFTCVFLEETLK